ncbi:transglycosylase domain-containing protein [Microbacterium amylolyticum]|uniref:Membrane peptidoglycan carboxypeptidase n=1 Tax=Microbacterium amylolyticum TaxID=936337 RepID=A0ABS4ZJK5_9MICO|nr:transglycosylase domain-containing protein [Microbacterium amylolyticum]MBP2437474.1 membrane peptidoglycan carboxypeptidase [Microbacterium amylolyticum]
MPHAKRTVGGVLGGFLGLVGLSAVAGVLVTATVTPAIAVSGYTASSAISLFENLPGYLEVDRPMEVTTIYAKTTDGKDFELASFYDQNREPVEYDEVSQLVFDALLASEDPRYYEHGGVDLIGTTRAILSNAASDETQGGSSISQQYVKNVQVEACERTAESDEERIACYNEATDSEGVDGYQRKLQEMRYAIAIEQEYSKEEIILGYLNLANFGGTTYGIEAAAQRYFSKSAKDVSLSEAATLAGMVQNPNTFRLDVPESEANGAENGYARTLERRDYVLYRMVTEGKITQKQYDEAKEQPIEPKLSYRERGCSAAGGSGYFCQYVKETIVNDTRYASVFGETREERIDLLSRGGLDIYTSLDFDMQQAAEATMEANVPATHDQLRVGSSLVQIKPQTGEILSMAQNTRFNEVESGEGQTSLVYAADQEHGAATGFEVGSTYKLFTLIDWLEQGRSVREMVNGANRPYQMTCHGSPTDAPAQIQNFGNGAGRTADVVNFTATSLNTGFLAMAEQLDICDIHGVAERLDVKTGGGGSVLDQLGPFSVLGSQSIDPITMASAYATVANGGVQCEPTAITGVVAADGTELELPDTTCERKLDENIAATTAYALAAVMGGPGATATQANPNDGVPIIGKTGTAEGRSTWMIQTTTNVTTAAWVGSIGEDTVEKFLSIDMYRMTNQHGTLMSSLRYNLARDVQAAANRKYGGDAFPEPDSNLIRVVEADVPSVVGDAPDAAERKIREAGFQPRIVSDRVTGVQDSGRVERTDPSGRAPVGSVVNIFVSDGNGVEVPNVSGQTPPQAVSELSRAGLRGSLGQCTENGNANRPRVTETNPSAGESVEKGTTVTVSWEARNCDTSFEPDEDDD